MSIFFKYTFLLVLSLIFIGCAAGSKNQVSQPESTLPSWYINPKTSDSLFYYAVSEGASKDEAKLNALSQVSSEISVSISSSLDIQKISKNDFYQKEIKQNTKSSTDKIKFTGVEIVSNAYFNGMFYTYVKVNRDILFKAQKRSFDIKYKQLLTSWNDVEENGAFALFRNNSDLKKNIAKTFLQLSQLKAISNKFNQTTYTNKLIDIDNKLTQLKSNAVVYVTNSKSSQYQNVLKKYISNYGMTLVDNPSKVKNKKNVISIKVTKQAKSKRVKSTDPRLKGASFAEVVVTITTKNYKNKIVAQNRIKVINISKEGYNAAVIKTSKFEREIKKKGILNILLGKTSN